MPALVLDLLWQRTARWGGWRQALVSGAVFLAVFAAVQWPFADFLMSPAARNWFFGAKYFGYYASPTSLYVRYRFMPPSRRGLSGRNWDSPWSRAILTTRLGMAAGDWMRRIQR